MNKMRLMILLIICINFGILFSSLVSAEIIFGQPKEIYNLGNTLSISITIKMLNNIEDFFQVSLICGGQEYEFYKEFIIINAGEEKKIQAEVVLRKSSMGEALGKCRIKAKLGEEYSLTNEFLISNLINIKPKINKEEFKPRENIFVEGTATRENGELVNGFVEIGLSSGIQFSENISEEKIEGLQLFGTVNKGVFSLNFSLPSNTKAGMHTANLRIYEKDSKGDITNEGNSELGISIVQVPANLEIIISGQEIEPGTSQTYKAILHDQTGEPIESDALFIIKDPKAKIIEQMQGKTSQDYEFVTKNSSSPGIWTIYVSTQEKDKNNKLENEINFQIKEKLSASFKLINNSLIITNTGNIPYKNIVLIKIGEEPMNIEVDLDVGKSEEYSLTAPNGEYNIEISDGQNKVEEKIALTGNAIDIKKVSSGIIYIARYPFVWIFVIAILAILALMLFGRTRKREFIGREPLLKPISKKEAKKEPVSLHKWGGEKLITGQSVKEAELAINIRGEEHDASVVCLKIKNKAEIETTKGNAKETLKQIVDLATENKATLYQTGEYMFFILSPLLTRTFKNEKTAIRIATEAMNIMGKHNKLFKQKIDFGISLNYGSIIAKLEEGKLKFISPENLIIVAKRIAGISEGDILLSDKIAHKVMPEVKYDKIERGGIVAYKIRSMIDRDQSKEFISSFLNRLERR